MTRVPDYSPYAVAEFTLALMLALNRKLPRAYTRVREGNFSLDGLLGFDLHGKTAGVIGTGKIGGIVARLLLGFGVRTLAYDVAPQRRRGRARRALHATSTSCSRSPTSSRCTARCCPRPTTSSTARPS